MRCVAVTLLLLAEPLFSAAPQTTVRAATPLLSAPAGRELATVRSGAQLRASTARQGHTQVTLDGYVDATLLGPGRDSFPSSIKAPSGARLRSAGRPDATIIADLRDGMGVTLISRQGTWVRVRRSGWIPTPALGARASTPPSRQPAGGAGAGQRPGARAGGTQDSVSTPPSVDGAQRAPTPAGALTPAASALLRTAPDGDSIGRIAKGASVLPLSRSDGWTRVRVEAWVRDDELLPADTSLRLSMSAADIRAAPEQARGALVRWTVQFIALQRADPLRPELRPEEPYVLARGPGDENALIYIAVPPSLMADVEGLQPLTTIVITARVRVGRSAPVGVPILDLTTISRK